MRFKRVGLVALALCCGAPSGAAANVQVGFSGWQWGNPLPQGNTIHALDFAGQTGYAAGAFGTLLKTTDAGASWSGLPVGTFATLRAVEVVDANTVVAGGGCVGRRSIDGGRTFTRIAFTAVEASCPVALTDLSFTSANAGHVLLADGTVLQTSDGGVEFAQRTALPGTQAAGGTEQPRTIAFVSGSRGFAATNGGSLFETTDAGVSWKLVRRGAPLNDIVFVDAGHAVAVGDGGAYLRSDDGGATWTAVNVRAGNRVLSSVRCAGPERCLATTSDGSRLFRVVRDGDQTASSEITPSTQPILAAAFASADAVAAAGLLGVTVISRDGGLTFSPVGGALAGTYRALRAGSQPGTAYALGADGALARTLDGGRTWTRGSVATSEDVADVSFPSASVGYARDAAGGLFRTSSGGASWRPLDTGSAAGPDAVMAVGERTLLAVGPRGVRRSTDGGETFSGVAGRALVHGVDRAGRAIVIWGGSAVLTSTNAGARWAKLRLPRRGRRRPVGVEQVDFVGPRAGFLLDDSGRIWRTRNRGRSWSELTATGTELALGMAFSSARRGYLVVSGFGDLGENAGVVLRTDDGGATWRPQLVIDKPLLADGIAAPGGPTDYLLGDQNALLFTTTGGVAGEPSRIGLRGRRRVVGRRRVTIAGTLRPAVGNERVTVSYRPAGSIVWRHQTVRTAGNGRFTTSWRVGLGSHRFVAQWQGDFRSAGAGSRAFSVRVVRRRRG